jgi:hypothetical protein
MLHSGSETGFVGAMIVQILVQLGGNPVFDRCFHRVRSETGANSLAKFRRSATLAYLSDTGARHDACQRALTVSAFLPMFDIGMTAGGNDSL